MGVIAGRSGHIHMYICIYTYTYICTHIDIYTYVAGHSGAVELLGDMLGSGPGCAGKAAVGENIPTDKADPPPRKRARVERA